MQAVTKHPVRNEDGSSDLVKITTLSGREMVATKGLSFLTEKDGKIVVTRGDELMLRMRVPVCKKILHESNPDPDLDLESIRKFFAFEDSGIAAQDVQFALNNLGIQSGMHDGVFIVEERQMKRFNLMFPPLERVIKVQSVAFSSCDNYGDIFLDPITSVEIVKNESYVYDFTVADTRNFITYNLIGMHDTFHLAGQEVIYGMKDIPYINKIVDKINDKTPFVVINLKKEFNDNEKVVD